jgi:hypothetical protein
VNSADLRSDVLLRLRQWRWRLVWQRLLLTATTISVFVVVSLLAATATATILKQIVAITIIMFALLLASSKFRQLSADNFLQHLNRRFPNFEESAQLLLSNDADLGVLQELQRDRAATVYQDNLARVEQWQAPVKYANAMAIILLCMPLAYFSAELRSSASGFFHNIFPNGLQLPISGDQSDEVTRIENIEIHIQPPTYTGLDSTQSDKLDLEVAEGSLVKWSLSFSMAQSAYALEMSDGERLELTPAGGVVWQTKTTVRQSDLYKIIAIDGNNEATIDEIYTLSIILDQAPDIRVMEPEVSILEIPKNGPASFTSTALVKDDYGIHTVKIMASVAKGSGEGVKFRDQQLSFDESSVTENGSLYQREWDLQALGMEPGDEIYFTVIATDNKQPEPNTGRSETLIVRWLEDETTGLAAEGLAIDFIPEFFKSQRQIIIDTEQLIEDENKLQLQQFKDTSYEIGQAQADLKYKYGQYLGDEFGEGPGEQLGIMHEIAQSNASANAGASEDASETESDGHEHDGAASINSRMNTTAEILQLFGHDHGDPEIGPITKRNPVALMKRAVSEMWQAEKHLMQAEPELALPFEYEAYKYLKLARQADRIYVKRLGFEPPPVTEDRRLTGDLDEILTYQTSENTDDEDLSAPRADQQLFRNTYQLISTQSASAVFNASQQALLTRLSARLMALSQQRPALIKQAASVENLIQTGRLQLDNCEDCIAELGLTVWNLMGQADAALHQPKAAYYNNEDLIQSYQHELQKVSVSPAKPPRAKP